MLSSPARREGRQRGLEDPGRGTPRHTGRRPFLGTRSSKQSPEPLVPVAAKAGMSPSGRAHGYQGHYKFPALHRAQPGPGADNKRFSSLSHRLCGTPSPTTEPKPGAGRKQRSSNQRPPALEGRTLSPARAPGPGASEDPTLSGPSAPCWPESEDEPRVLHSHSPAKQHRAVAVPGGPGRRRACAQRGWGSSLRETPRSPGHRAERSGGLGSPLSPRAGQRSGGRHQTK